MVCRHKERDVISASIPSGDPEWARGLDGEVLVQRCHDCGAIRIVKLLTGWEHPLPVDPEWDWRPEQWR